MSSWEHDGLKTTRLFYEAGAREFADRVQDRSHLDYLHDRFAALVVAGGLVVDLGCGPAQDSTELARRGLRPVGLDLTRAMLREGRQRGSAALLLVQGDSRCLPFPDNAFDGVWACASLLHLPKGQVSIALAEVARVLKRGAIFFSSMQVGEHDGLVGVGDPLPRHYAFYRPGDWRRRVEAARFEVVDLRSKQDRTSVNSGAEGWIETFARAP